MTTSVAMGNKAEESTSNFLAEHGYKIIARNWRTPRCEIDIIAYKDKVIFFVEVKYRSQSNQGMGTEYVTVAKRRRMEYAATLWTARYGWLGDYCLSVASVSGQSMTVEFIEQI